MPTLDTTMAPTSGGHQPTHHVAHSVQTAGDIARRRLHLHHVLVRRRRWAKAMDRYLGRWS